MADTNIPELDLAKLNVQEDDKASRKLLMLVEGTYGIGMKKSIAKYGYTEQRYYQLKKGYMEGGFEALIDRKKGPKENYIRNADVEKLIVRLRFLDPDSGADVIAQKLNQMGINISKRSVERSITTFGLQKKTSLS